MNSFLQKRPSSIPGKPGDAGFTLIELLVTIAILVIVISVAAPSFTDATLGSRLGSFANDFVNSAYLARGEAIKRNKTIELCVSANPNATIPTCATGGWEQGWIIREQDTGNVILRHMTLQAGFHMREISNTSSLLFQSTGLTSAAASLTVCRATPSVGDQERVVTLTVSGRGYVNTTHSGSCS